jgi:IS4 transposase
VFLTNNFELPALTIAERYRCRWQVELFFKWIKQHLRIKKLYGNSENAVKTQIWISIATYVLVLLVKKTDGAGAQSLHNSTDFERLAFRENAALAGIFK